MATSTTLSGQIQRESYLLRKTVMSDHIPDYAVTGKYKPEWLEKVEPGDFALEGYRHHAALSASMAVHAFCRLHINLPGRQYRF